MIDAYFTENGLPSPSLEASTHPDLPLPPQIVAAKEAALEAMDELQVLLLGPMPKIFHDLIHIVSPLIGEMYGYSNNKSANKSNELTCHGQVQDGRCVPSVGNNNRPQAGRSVRSPQ
jgi:hypothetical protein